MEKLSVLPVLSTGAMVAIGFFVISTLVVMWAIYTAKPMTDEEDGWERFYDEMYKYRASTPLSHHEKKGTKL